MKKAKRNLLLVAASLVMMLMANAAVASAAISVKPNYICYAAPAADQWGTYTYITIDGMKNGQKIIKSSLKSSNKSVAIIESISHYTSIRQCLSYRSTETSQDTDIGVYVKKPGKTKISFKIGNKTYSTELIVKKYVNPCETLNIKGINDGKNLASKYKSNTMFKTKLSAAVKKSSITVKAKDGWRVDSISIANNSTKSCISFSNMSDKKSVTSTVLNIGDLNKGTGYTIFIDYTNIENGSSIYQTLEIKK